MRGRPRKSESEKVFKRPSRERTDVIDPKKLTKMPVPTLLLKEVGMKQFKGICKELMASEQLANVDIGLLSSACLAYQNHVALEALMPEVTDRYETTDKGNRVLSVESIESARQLKIYQDIVLKLGVTPYARQRIVTKPSEGKDELGEFLAMAANRGKRLAGDG